MFHELVKESAEFGPNPPVYTVVVSVVHTIEMALVSKSELAVFKACKKSSDVTFTLPVDGEDKSMDLLARSAIKLP
jgi:hypothetical protein